MKSKAKIISVIILGMLTTMTGCSIRNISMKPIDTSNVIVKPAKGNQGITTNILKYEIIAEALVPASIINSIRDIRTQRGFALITNADGSNLVCIGTGEKASGGHSISIKSIKDVEGITKIIIEEVKPKPSEISTMQLMYPSIFVKVLGGTPNIQVTNTENVSLKGISITNTAKPAGKINRPNIQAIDGAVFNSRIDSSSIKATVNNEEKTFISDNLDYIMNFSKVKDGDKVRLFYAEKDKGVLELYEIIVLKQ